ncbi:hypothetical protein RclHR1_12730010 [Rhizophagus clarus]|uniref:Uncharacterized protein n=1 Tax=Rhizophagus clarus TaxID=94130 RepID=A0A2Z6Q841_9GLOM|nr:hypothetical protein RclHR1_12730010 [Rhizophagus clarus]
MILSHQMFTWSKLVKDAQSDEYMKYIKEVIKLPSGLEWYNVKKNQKFFNSTNQKWLPFSLKGTTDIAILTKGYLGCMDQKYVRFRIVIELKKVGNVDAKAHFQTQGELITANHWSNHKILQECIDVESSDFKKNLKFEDDYPFIKRRKLNTTNIGASDVVDLNDFVNVCPSESVSLIYDACGMAIYQIEIKYKNNLPLLLIVGWKVLMPFIAKENKCSNAKVFEAYSIAIDVSINNVFNIYIYWSVY